MAINIAAAIRTSKTKGKLSPRLLTDERRQLVDLWLSHPWEYATGVDNTGAEPRALIMTQDEKNMAHPIRPFPTYHYLHAYLDILHAALYQESQHATVVPVDKSRQMVVTWASCIFLDWLCQKAKKRSVLLIKNVEEESGRVLQEKIISTHNRMPKWFQEWSPIHPTKEDKPQLRVFYGRTGSQFVGGKENLAETMGRGGSVTAMLLDEATRQWELDATINACSPMVRLIIAVSTPDSGTPSADAYLRMLERTDPGPQRVWSTHEEEYAKLR
jgi:hypothetical protein